MKNNTLRNMVIAILSLLALANCNDEEFLSVLPKGMVICKTSSDFRRLLDAADSYTQSYSLIQTIAMLDVLSDDVSIDSAYWKNWTSSQMHFQRLFVFDDYVWAYPNLTNDFNWKSLYYVNSITSVALIELDRVTDDLKMKMQLKAEARVHRAYTYLLLVNCYAKAYNPETASTDLGVPLLPNPTALPALKRNTVQEVYEFIVNELTESIDDLPDDVDQYKHRPAKTTVYAILARTYLYMGDYEKALLSANKSLQIRNFLYDYNTQYTGTEPFYSKFTSISKMTDEEMLWHKVAYRNLYTYNYYHIDTTTFNQIYPGFDRNGNNYINYDLRRTLWFYGWNSNNTTKLSNYAYHFRYYGNSPSYRYYLDYSTARYAYYNPITTGEMYVTRAECNARLGNLQAALDDINEVAVKRYRTGTYTPLILSSVGGQAAVIEEVLKERRRELYGKELRLFDIKRLHLPMTHYLSSLKITVPADDPRFVLPILDHYIELNPELEQNDRSVSGVTYQ